LAHPVDTLLSLYSLAASVLRDQQNPEERAISDVKPVLQRYNARPRRLRSADTHVYTPVGRGPTSATEPPSVQLDLESGIKCRRTSDSRTCHTVVSDSRCQKHFIWLLGPKRSV